MSSMLPPPVRGTRATVSPPLPVLTPVEQEAAAYAQERGVAAPQQAASPAPAPQPEQAAAPPLRPRQIPAAFAGIDFTIGAVVSDTGDTYPIHPDDMPKLLDFAFRVAMNVLQDDVTRLRASLGLPEPNEGGDPNGPATEGQQALPEVPADEAPQQVQEG